MKKNTDIPNSYPFKKEVLNAIRIKKELEQEEKLEQRKARRAENKRKRETEMGLGSVEELQRRAQMKQMEYESKTEMMTGDEDLQVLFFFLFLFVFALFFPAFFFFFFFGFGFFFFACLFVCFFNLLFLFFSFQSLQAANDGSRKAYFREFRKVVDESDVILEVLDARFEPFPSFSLSFLFLLPLLPCVSPPFTHFPPSLSFNLCIVILWDVGALKSKSSSCKETPPRELCW